MGMTGTTQIPAEVSAFYDRTLLDQATPLLVHDKWAQMRDIPRKAGTLIIKFRRYGLLNPATTPLTEGVTPAGSQLSVTDITAEALQYGDYITITDVVDFSTQDPELMEAAEVLGEQAGETSDILTREVLNAGSNVYYPSTHTSRSQITSSDLITAILVKKVTRLLKNNNAKKLTNMVNPANAYNTTPLNACFVGIVHPNTTYTLKDLSGFIRVEQYPNKGDVMDGEIGTLDEVRFVESTNAKVFEGEGSGGIDVYSTVIMGKNAYGVTKVSGEGLKNIVKPFGAGDDPLNQRATSGWKMTKVAKILNDAFICRIEHAVAA